MCDACKAPDLYDTIPAAHDRACPVRAPYLRFETMPLADLRAALPALREEHGTAVAMYLERPDDTGVRLHMKDTGRALRAATDALAKFRPASGRWQSRHANAARRGGR